MCGRGNSTATVPAAAAAEEGKKEQLVKYTTHNTDAIAGQKKQENKHTTIKHRTIPPLRTLHLPFHTVHTMQIVTVTGDQFGFRSLPNDNFHGKEFV